MTTITDKHGLVKPIIAEAGKPHKVSTAYTEEHGSHVQLTVNFGLHYISGNSAPYFSITADGRENYSGDAAGYHRDSFGGCCHDVIAEQFPGALDDVIALHLSDMDGSPSYAEANGWYWLAKAAGIPERYEPDQSVDECKRIFASHCRIEPQRVDDIIAELLAIEPIAHAVKPHAIRRECWARICETMRPRWKREADACIEKYALAPYGDTWPKPDKLLVANGLAS